MDLILGATIAIAWSFIGTLIFRLYDNDTDYYAVLAVWNVPTISVPAAIIIMNLSAAPLWAIGCAPVAFLLSAVYLYAVSRQPRRFDAGHTFRP